MRVKVTLQNIIEYGLDTLTGNPRVDLLARAAEMKKEGYELFVNIPDVAGGDKDAPSERNIFKHYNSDLPVPEGEAHEISSFDLRDQMYVQNPCSYKRIRIGNGEIKWFCNIHEVPSKHSVDADSHAPCLTVDPYPEGSG